MCWRNSSMSSRPDQAADDEEAIPAEAAVLLDRNAVTVVSRLWTFFNRLHTELLGEDPSCNSSTCSICPANCDDGARNTGAFAPPIVAAPRVRRIDPSGKPRFYRRFLRIPSRRDTLQPAGVGRGDFLLQVLRARAGERTTTRLPRGFIHASAAPASISVRPPLRARCPRIARIAQLLSVSAVRPVFSAPTIRYFNPNGDDNTPYGTVGPTGLNPTQIRHAYGIDSILFQGGTITGDGSGQTVAIIDAFDNPKFVNSSDSVELFRTATCSSSTPRSACRSSARPAVQRLPKSTRAAVKLPRGEQRLGRRDRARRRVGPRARAKANILLVEANDNSNANLLSGAAKLARAARAACPSSR